MSIESINTLTTISGPGMFWAPDNFEAFQQRDYLDFRAVFGSRKISILKLMSNRDVHVYGELMLHDGAIRGYNTMSFTCYEDGGDIASFRSGEDAGDEKLRITRDGDVELQGEVQGIIFPGLTLRAQTRDGEYTSLSFVGETATFKLLDGSTLRTWGSLTYDGSNERLLDIKDSSDTYRVLNIKPRFCTILAQMASGSGAIFEVKDDTSTSRFQVLRTGNAVQFHGRNLTIEEDVDLSALGGGNMVTVGDRNSEAGPVLVHLFQMTNVAGETKSATMNDRIRVIDVIVIKRYSGGVGDTVVVKDDGGSNITDIINVNIATNDVARPISLDGAHQTIDAGDALQVTTVSGSDPRCEVHVIVMRVS